MRPDQLADDLAEMEEADAAGMFRELSRWDRWVLRRLVLKNPTLRYYLRARFQAEALARFARQLRLTDPDRTPTERQLLPVNPSASR
jgi:hypothetical protein